MTHRRGDRPRDQDDRRRRHERRDRDGRRLRDLRDALACMIFKQFGVGLAAAILIDATIVRAILLPASMKLLGDWNWYLPRWLEWLPHLEHGERSSPVEAPPVPTPAVERHDHLGAAELRIRQAAAARAAAALSHRDAASRGSRSPSSRSTSSTTTSSSPSRARRPATTWSAGSCRSRSSSARAGPIRALGPGCAATLALLVGLFGVVAGVGEAGYYTLGERPVRRRLHRAPVAPGRPAPRRHRGRDALEVAPQGDSALRRYVRRGCSSRRRSLVADVRALPARDRLRRHALGAAYVPTADLGAAYEEVTFTTSDGLRLQGWYVPSRTARRCLLPGPPGPQKPRADARRHGYGVLLFDRRGEGESEGDPNAFGWDGDARSRRRRSRSSETRPDVDPDRIGGIGLSVGGEMMLQAAAESDAFQAIVSEGAGVRSVREAVHVPGTAKLMFTEISRRRDASEPPSSRATCRRPALWISAQTSPSHCSSFTPTRAKAARPSAASTTKLRRVRRSSGSRRVGIRAQSTRAPEEYERRIVGFFDETLLER